VGSPNKSAERCFRSAVAGNSCKISSNWSRSCGLSLSMRRATFFQTFDYCLDIFRPLIAKKIVWKNSQQPYQGCFSIGEPSMSLRGAFCAGREKLSCENTSQKWAVKSMDLNKDPRSVGGDSLCVMAPESFSRSSAVKRGGSDLDLGLGGFGCRAFASLRRRCQE